MKKKLNRENLVSSLVELVEDAVKDAKIRVPGHKFCDIKDGIAQMLEDNLPEGIWEEREYEEKQKE